MHGAAPGRRVLFAAAMKDKFRNFATSAAEGAGTPWAFLAALSMVVLWGLTGPAFGFSSTWQLLINTPTTIVTFLMMFLLQHSQNRDARAINLKLDELIRISHARNIFADLEEADDEELEKFRAEFRRFRSKQIHKIRSLPPEERGNEDPTVKGTVPPER